MDARKADEKNVDAFSGWLIRMFGEISPSFLEDEIPERDLEVNRVDLAEQNPQPEPEPRTQTNWKIVVVVSGFAAACSAAAAGIAVFACMRRFAAFGGAHRA
ncbi:MAG: hypothetical protein LUD18_04830 [Lachnospiraceae bacterium]|nr:hypothetical protein [Lachnospiraceae bacterium]